VGYQLITVITLITLMTVSFYQSCSSRTFLKSVDTSLYHS